MFRLIDDIARCRLLYRAPLPTAPSVLLLDIPPGARGCGLALGRYYPLILETAAEIDEAEVFLRAAHDRPVIPDLFDRRPSGVRSDSVMITRLAPARDGWPEMIVCYWPAATFHEEIAGTVELARGHYTMEAAATPADADRLSYMLVAALSAKRDLNLRMIAAETLPDAGR